MNFDVSFKGTLRIPLIAAPMFLISSPAMALACCANGVMGSFPAHSTRTREVFADWLVEMEEGLATFDNPAPWAVNLVVHPTNKRMQGDLALCIKHKVPVILTSKGAPDDIFDRIHDYGGLAFHDVASARHAEKATQAGADAVIAVCGGAGGHTGSLNPFALLNEIREVTDKPIIVSGGLSTGQDVLAAQTMGGQFAYMGTRFIACEESLATDDCRDAMFQCRANDVFYTAALDGAPANFLIPSLRAAGIEPDDLAVIRPGEIIDSTEAAKKYSNIYSAGHGVGMVKKRESAHDICQRIIAEYEAARQQQKMVLA